MGLEGGREAAAGHEEVLDVPADEAAIGDLVGPPLSLGTVDTGARRGVDVDREAAHRDGVVEPRAREDVLAGEHVEALDAARLADPDLGGGLEEPAMREPGDRPLEEGEGLPDLAIALLLGGGELLADVASERLDPRHVHRDLATAGQAEQEDPVAVDRQVAARAGPRHGREEP